MKTETQIAKKNIECESRSERESGVPLPMTACFSHRESCERFLGFLEGIDFSSMQFEDWRENDLDDKITDLKKAIKLYEKVVGT